MNDILDYSVGTLGYTAVLAWINPFFWMAVFVALVKKWSYSKAALVGIAVALGWGVLFSYMQSWTAQEYKTRLTSADNWDYTIHLFLMGLHNAIWLMFLLLIWTWAMKIFRFTKTHTGKAGSASYAALSTVAPEIANFTKDLYRDYRRRSETLNAGDAFEIAGKELQINRPVAAIWAKAVMLSKGHEERTKSVYIKLRVEQIIKDRQKVEPEPAPRDRD